MALRAFDVRYVFGVSGANIEHVHDAIHRLGAGSISSVMAKCESGAAFMADSYARVHRRLGVCCSTSGGGMLNLVAGLAESFEESVPVLAIVGQPPLNLEGKGAFQDSSGRNHSVQGEVFLKSLSKHVIKILRPEDFWPSLTQAIFLALSGRPGASILMIPRDLYEQETHAPEQDWASQLKARIELSVTVEKEAQRLFEALASAKSPVVIIGHGVRRSRRGSAVREFASLTNIPVATTLSGRAEYPNDAPNYLGMVGAAGHPSVHRYIAESADLLVVVGTGLNIMNRGPLGPVFEKTKSVFVNIDAEPIAATFPRAEIILGDAGEIFEELLRLCKTQKLRYQLLANYRRQIFAPTLASPLENDAPAPRELLQSDAIALIKEILPRNGHLIFDAGNCAAAAMHLTFVPSGASSTIALGMGGMGYAVGGAIGAQIGSAPNTRSIAFVGDGAFLMSGMEIHTAVELKLPILYVIFNNRMHGMCVTRQQLFFEGRIECASYQEIDVTQMVRGLGSLEQIWTGQATTQEELAHLLDDYLKHAHLPGVLELKIAREQVPPFTPFLPKDAPVLDL